MTEIDQTPQVPEEVLASADLLRHALMDGGHATVTARNPETGRHVSLVLVVRKKRPTGGFVPRNTAAGRVGLTDGDVVEARDPFLEYPENYVGRRYKDGGNRAFTPGRGADLNRSWLADVLLRWALDGEELSRLEVFLATRCICCSRKLTHPESVAELIGPECSGRRRNGRAAARGAVAA